MTFIAKSNTKSLSNIYLTEHYPQAVADFFDEANIVNRGNRFYPMFAVKLLGDSKLASDALKSV